MSGNRDMLRVCRSVFLGSWAVDRSLSTVLETIAAAIAAVIHSSHATLHLPICRSLAQVSQSTVEVQNGQENGLN